MKRLYSTCDAAGGKRCLTFEEASQDIRSLRRSKDGEHVHLYKCPHWRDHPKWMYHVGHVREKAT